MKCPRMPPLIRRLAGSAWDTTDRLKSQRAAAAFVPSNVCVEADDRIASDEIGSRSGDPLGSEVDEVVLSLSGPIGSEGPFHASADRPAGSGFAA